MANHALPNDGYFENSVISDGGRKKPPRSSTSTRGTSRSSGTSGTSGSSGTSGATLDTASPSTVESALSSFGISGGNPQQATMAGDTLRSSTHSSESKPGTAHKKKKKKKDKQKKGHSSAAENKDSKKKKKKKSKSTSDPPKRRSSATSSSLTEDVNMAAYLGEGETAGIMSGDEMHMGASDAGDDDSVWGDENEWEDWAASKMNMMAAAEAQAAAHNLPTAAAAPPPARAPAIPTPTAPPRRSKSIDTYDATDAFDATETQFEWSDAGHGRQNREFAGFDTTTTTNIGMDASSNNHNDDSAILTDLQSFMDENVSVLTEQTPAFAPSSYHNKEQQMIAANDPPPTRAVRRISANSGAPDQVPHELLVNYMLAMGANRAAAEELALSFAAEQQGNAVVTGPPCFSAPPPNQRPAAGRPVKPAAVTLSHKLKEVERGFSPSQFEEDQSNSNDQHSTASFSFTGQQSLKSFKDKAETFAPTTANFVSGPTIVEAMPVNDDIEANLPIVYADTTPIGFKDLVHERPVQRLFCLGVLAVIGAIIGTIVYFTVLVDNSPTARTASPTVAPSFAPTFISDDIFEAAGQLSGYNILADTSSPQFKAVGWMSTFDEALTGAIGGEAFAQRYALVVMYYSLEGENWINQEKWLMADENECNWSGGIMCSLDETGSLTVTGFDATRNNLQGTLPHEIGILSSAGIFRIPKNKVGGTIPDSIGQLTSLSAVDLSDNALTGAIPATFEGARDLIRVDLSKNQLNSTVPNGLYNLRFLRTLVLTSNKLSGPISSSINNLTSLVTLDMRHNQLSGSVPFTLDSIKALDVVLLDYNQLTGKLPPVTPSLTLKQTLSLSHNQFSGNIELHPTYININDPSELRLQHVDVSYNKLSGPISPIFGFLPTLRYIDFSGNGFAGPFASSTGWINIEFLAAANNSLTGTIPVGYATLTHLDFSDNQFTEGIPEELCDYPDLEFLLLSGNPLASTIPSCLADVPKLRDLELSNCSLTGPIIPALGQIPDLFILDLSNNLLSSTIPKELGDLVSLKHLELQENSLTGSIPTEMANMMDLQTLNLTKNDLSGTFPPELAALVELESMELQGNIDLQGSIPPGLCNLSNLELLSEEIGCGIVCDCCSDIDAFCK